jgi:hypothetical protein
MHASSRVFSSSSMLLYARFLSIGVDVKISLIILLSALV